MTSPMTFDAVGLAGGGNRCYWQSGFLKAFSEHQPLKPRFYVAVSASAYHGAMHIAGVGERVRNAAFAFAERAIAVLTGGRFGGGNRRSSSAGSSGNCSQTRSANRNSPRSRRHRRY